MNFTHLPNNGATTNLILQALVRKLIEKNLLSDDDVRAVLFDAAEGIDVDGGSLTPQAARDIAHQELIPAFLGTAK